MGLRRHKRPDAKDGAIITCSEATRQLWEYLDATTGAPTREAIEDHLSRCRACCGELEFAQELRRFLASSAHDQVPDGSSAA